MNLLPTIAIVVGLLILAGIGVAKWLMPGRDEPEAVIEECTIIDGAKACTRVPVDTIDELPEEARAVVQSADAD